MLAGMTSRFGRGRVLDDVAHVVAALDEQVVDGHVELVGADAQPHGQRTLRVEVDEQHLAADLGQRGTEVDGRRGLADATLLVAHGDDAGRAVAAQRRRLGEVRHRAAGRAELAGARGLRARAGGRGRGSRALRTTPGCRSGGRTTADCVVTSGSTGVSLPVRWRTSVSLALIGHDPISGRGVALCVHLAQPLHRHERVDLRRGDRGVPQQLLHHPDVGTAVEQVGGERVPQGVRRHVARPGWARSAAARITAQADCRDSRPPRWLRNTAGVPLALRRRRWGGRARGRRRWPRAAYEPRGTSRSLLPLPNSRTTPSAVSMSSTSRPTASEIRAPAPYSTSSRARSRSDAGVSPTLAASSRPLDRRRR